MRKIAIISDIHGNMPALEAVLKDIKDDWGTDEIYCLGDLVDAAPWHNEVIATIRQLQIPTIMGNHDERIAFAHEVIPMPKHTVEETEARTKAIGITKLTIDMDHKTYLANLPRSIEIDLGTKKLLLIHGSTHSNREYVFENIDDAKLREMFVKSDADIICGGHTHLSYIKKIDDKLWINAGSVGRSREMDSAKAVYLQLTIDNKGDIRPTLRKINYDVQQTIKGIEHSELPNFYADFLRKQLGEESVLIK